MLKSANRTGLAVLASLFIVVAGCGKKDAATPFNDTDSLLRYVPADTPYFLGVLEPSPDEVFDKMEPYLQDMFASYGEMLGDLEEMLENPEEWETGDPAEKEAISVIVKILKPLMSPDGYLDAGFSRESTSVLYGNGLLPVLRFTVAESGPLDAWVSDIEAEAGVTMTTATVNGKSYRYLEAEEMNIILGTFDNQLILTVAPATFEDDQLAELLGITLPSENIADTGVLQEIADEYSYLPQYIGFVDTRRLADTFITAPSGLNAGLLSLMEYDSTTLSDVCATELRGLAAVMPRMVIGAEQVSAERVDSLLVLELRDDIADGLTAIPAMVPGLGKAYEGLFSFGMSVDVLAAREFYAGRIETLENDPFECELLEGFQQSVVAGREALNQPVPPVAYGFKGFLAVVNDIDGFTPGQSTPPESVDGSLLVAMDNAQGLLALGQMFSPELYEMDIQPDGRPHLLDIPAVQSAGVESAWLAMTDDAIALSLSEDGESVLPGMLEAAGASPPPFISMNMDAGRYYEFVAESVTARQDEMAGDFPASMARTMTSIGDLYDQFYMDVLFTKRGIEISMDTTFVN